jgi:poly-gamma-glutamate synthesis protein (capsule biosynthesis protein)
VRLLLGGDIQLSRYVWLTAQRRKDPTYPFHKIRQFLEGADIAFANLECVFVENPPFFEDRMVFRTHPSMVEGLKAAGIDIVSTANNHCRDAGSHGLEFTLQHLEQHGIAAVGTALTPQDTTKGTVIERKGVRFGFLAYTFDQRNGNHLTNDPRIAMLDESTVGRDVEALRTRCDVVIVSMHAGWEYWTTPNALQQRFAHAAIDGGAAVVAGHHPHVVQPVEEYKGGVIFYSLGNLVFDQAVRKGVREGAIGEVGFHGKQLSWHKLHPITIRDTVPTL